MMQLSFADADFHPHQPRVRISSRARRLSLRVHRDASVEVVVPPRISPRRVQHFLASHAGWIATQVAAARSALPAPQPFPPTEILLPALAERWQLQFEPSAKRFSLTAQGGGHLLVKGHCDTAQFAQHLRRWLLQHATSQIGQQLQALAGATGWHYRQLTVRRQRRRWGSCSPRRTISLNICLVFQSPDIARYLMIHELAHLAHMNHSSQFWQAVALHCPNWRQLDRELLTGWRQVPQWIFL